MSSSEALEVREGHATADSVEQKFAFSMAHLTTISTWLEFALAPDPVHASNVVHSVYFDTPDLRHYDEKRHGDYLKAKVRLRWYGDIDTQRPDELVSCYLEVKRRIGSLRSKERELIAVSAAALRKPWSSSEFLMLPLRAAALGACSRGPLTPVVHIRYKRQRFVEACSGSRLSLDHGIRGTKLGPAEMLGAGPASLDTGVLELKGATRVLPPTLDAIGALLRKRAFSKYAECLTMLSHPDRRPS